MLDCSCYEFALKKIYAELRWIFKFLSRQCLVDILQKINQKYLVISEVLGSRSSFVNLAKMLKIQIYPFLSRKWDFLYSFKVFFDILQEINQNRLVISKVLGSRSSYLNLAKILKIRIGLYPFLCKKWDFLYCFKVLGINLW